ncbi:RmlC-like cupin domain-containing protein [Boletus edulis]|nr:RmlC-like cupin domain-containing protein [Boletus edulis]
MSSTTEPIFLIAPTLQKYDWGKVGNQSKVAQLAAGADIPGFVLDNSARYAELWMGTHVKSPSGVVGSSSSLPDILAANPHLIGSEVSHKFPTSRGNLPFLFKVLSINKALSIQTHPDKKTAEQLHASQPSVYTDDNHKPEMAIALTDFRGLCGFLPIPDIKTHLRNMPELRALVSEPPRGPEEREQLQTLFTALMQADPDAVKAQLSRLTARYRTENEPSDIKDLVLGLNEQYPGDVGVFCPFMLNYVKLETGQAIFLGAGEPHAYISGDIMECMANSDNVIRAGLTPKPKDIPNLLAGLTYKAAPWSNHMVQPSTSSNSATMTYDPPVQDFTVLALNLVQGGSESQSAINGPSITIATEGGGFIKWGKDGKSLVLQPGSVVFIGANVPVSFNALQTLTVFRAYVD